MLEKIVIMGDGIFFLIFKKKTIFFSKFSFSQFLKCFIKFESYIQKRIKLLVLIVKDNFFLF